MIVRYRMMHAGSAKNLTFHTPVRFFLLFPVALQSSIRHKIFNQDQQRLHTITTIHARRMANQIHGIEGVRCSGTVGENEKLLQYCTQQLLVPSFSIEDAGLMEAELERMPGEQS